MMTANEIERQAYTTLRVPTSRVGDLKERVAKLAARAEKKGLGEFRAEWTGVREREEFRRVDDEGVIVTAFADFEIWTLYSPAPLQIDGWELAARVEHAQGGNILHTVPGAATVPVEFRSTDSTRCDHCRTCRVRRDSFIVVNAETGVYQQVGRSCLADFLGRDPQSLLAGYTFHLSASASLSEEVEAWGGEARERPMMGVQFVLDLAARVGAVDGYRPAAFGEDSTKSIVCSWAWCILGRPSADRTKRLAAFNEQYPAEGRRVEAIREYCRDLAESLAATEMSEVEGDYGRNLKAALGSDAVDPRSMGLVVSVVSAACKRADEAAKDRGPDLSGSVHMGGLKERLRGLECSVVFARVFEGEWGARTLIKLEMNGSVLVWWASDWRDVAVGDRVRVTGTVKAHEVDDYLKVPVTVLTRCTLDVIEEAAEG